MIADIQLMGKSTSIISIIGVMEVVFSWVFISRPRLGYLGCLPQGVNTSGLPIWLCFPTPLNVG